MGSSDARIACPSCGQQFVWKPQYAGKKIHCKCGEFFAAISPETPAAEEYDLEPEYANVAPPAKKKVVAPPVFSPVAGTRDVDPHTAYKAKKLAARAGEKEESEVIGVWIPQALVGAGLTLRWYMLVHNQKAATDNFEDAALMVGLEVVLSTAMMLIGMYAAAAMLGVHFGELKRTITKAAGIAIFAGACGVWVSLWVDKQSKIAGPVLALHVVVLLYWIFFSLLFELEASEMLMTVAIVGLCQAMVGCVMWLA